MLPLRVMEDYNFIVNHNVMLLPKKSAILACINKNTIFKTYSHSTPLLGAGYTLAEVLLLVLVITFLGCREIKMETK